MSPSEQDVVEQSEAVLRTHARSFRWAAPFLPQDARRDAAVTYAFCRLVDDVVDERDDDDESRRELDVIERELDGRALPRPLVAAYREIEARRAIPREAAIELLAGMRMDLGEVRLRDDDELDLYCFRVAGTVGLMMAPILGARDPRAFLHAVDLGIGMQLTNICRDVAEDAGRGRVYLPADRLVAEGASQAGVLDGSAPDDAVLRVLRALLDKADALYSSGREGLAFLPLRARLGVAVAARLYRAIGLRVHALGARALRERAVVSPPRKLGHVAVAFWDALSTPTPSPKALPPASSGAADPARRSYIFGSVE